jgi:glycosyltransferase involved in cell wall biosynthesis
MQYPKISIVTPVFNQVKYIERTILSILGQEYPRLEYIIVDGGSTDGTLEIIEKYKNKISLVISEKDEGMYYALEKGFKHSSGDIMAWLNADDVYHSRAFFIVAELFQQYENIEFLMGQPTTLDEEDRFIHVSELRSWSKFDFYIDGTNWAIQQESTFWRRSLWVRSGGYIQTNYRLAADCELWARFLTHANAQIYMVNALLGGFRRRNDQLSQDRTRYNEEVKAIHGNTIKSPEDINTLRRIDFYKKYLIKIPVLRFIFPWNKRYISFFNYPPLLRYSFKEKRFLMVK